MAQNIKGRNVRVEVASAFGVPRSVSGVSLANPAIVTSTLHGLAQWTAGYFSGGMLDLEGQAAIVSLPTTFDSFAANGLDTRSYRFVVSGQFTPVDAWLTLAECTSYELGVESAPRLNSTTILHQQQRSRPGLLPAQTLALNLIAQTTPSLALLVLQSAALSRGAVLLRITHQLDGSLRVCRGDVTYPSEGASAGAMGTSAVTVAIDGLMLKLVGIAPPPWVPPAPPPAPTPPSPPPPSTPGGFFGEDYEAADYDTTPP